MNVSPKQFSSVLLRVSESAPNDPRGTDTWKAPCLRSIDWQEVSIRYLHTSLYYVCCINVCKHIYIYRYTFTYVDSAQTSSMFIRHIYLPRGACSKTPSWTVDFPAHSTHSFCGDTRNSEIKFHTQTRPNHCVVHFTNSKYQSA